MYMHMACTCEMSRSGAARMMTYAIRGIKSSACVRRSGRKVSCKSGMARACLGQSLAPSGLEAEGGEAAG